MNGLALDGRGFFTTVNEIETSLIPLGLQQFTRLVRYVGNLAFAASWDILKVCVYPESGPDSRWNGYEKIRSSLES